MIAVLNRSDYDAMQAFAFEKITVAGVGIGFTDGTYNPAAGKPALAAVVTVETNPIRHRYDGTDPDSTTGDLYQPGDQFVVYGSKDIANSKFIRTGSSGTIQVHYLR